MELETGNINLSNVVRSINKDMNLDNNLETMTKQATTTLSKLVDRAADYVIKAMPLPDSLKDILKDVKESLKTKDFKEIIKTIINSSFREGLEFLGVSKQSIKSILEFKDVIVKGGLFQGLKAGIEILTKKVINSNIAADQINSFFERLKENVLNKEFSKKFDNSIDKLAIKKDNFVQKCKEWYKAYDIQDYNKLNEIANELKSTAFSLKQDTDCIKENKVIQNMTEIINNKKVKLSNEQLQLCQNM